MAGACCPLPSGPKGPLQREEPSGCLWEVEGAAFQSFSIGRDPTRWKGQEPGDP